MNLKQMVGIEAAKYVEDGMIVGLGTGSTAKFMVDEIGRRVKEEGLSIVGVTTSKETEKQALALGIPLKSIDEVPYVDLTIDGADEVDKHFQGIKGGGRSHLIEKIVAINSARNIWIVDETKLVDTLGKFPLPLEVIPFGSGKLLQRLADEGLKPAYRLNEDGSKALTDSKNYIIDLHLGKIEHPHLLAEWLNKQVGIVEHGLFLDLVKTVVVGTTHGPEILDAHRG